MKKVFSIIIAMMSIVTNTYADDTFEVDGALYSVKDDFVSLEGFVNKEKIEHFRVPESITYNTRTIAVKVIGYRAFKDCENLESLSIAGSVESISNIRYPGDKVWTTQAFENCKKLKKLIFEDSSKSLFLPHYQRYVSYANYKNEGLFYDSCIEEVYIGRDLSGSFFFDRQPISKAEIGPLVTEITGTMFRDDYDNKIFKSIVIPESVKTIGEAAFFGCAKLEKIIFSGNNITRIEKNAFTGCKRLDDIKMPDSLKYIGQSAFGGCNSFKMIIIPDNVTEIDGYAFKGCKNLSRITIGKNVSHIYMFAFEDCPNLRTIISKICNPANCHFGNKSPFESSTYANSILYVPIGTSSLYKNANYWKSFFNIQESAEATDTTEETNTSTVQYLTIVAWGKSIIFALLEKPMITYQNNQLVVATSKETVEIPVGDISSIVFSGTSTAIHNLMSEDKPQVKGGLVYFSDLKPGTLIYVFTSDGKNIAKVKADYSGTAQVNLSEFPKGIYLIKAGKQTIKIINK